jgi:SAM-dependent methyltransferase
VPSELHSKFRERATCVLCGGDRLERLWFGHFGDEPVRSWLRSFHYDADLDQALSELPFERVVCQSCDMAFHRYVPDEQLASTLYGSWISPAQIEAFEQDHHRHDPNITFSMAAQLIKHLLRLRQLLDRNAGEPMRVLDFGCGDGAFLNLAHLFGVKAYGVDASATRLRRAERPGITVVASLAELDALATGPMDAITLFEVLEHVSDPLGLLVELRRRLRPSGILIVEVPDCHGIPAAPRTFQEFHDVQPLEHSNHFSPLTLRAMCGRAGYAPIAKPPAHVTAEPIAVLKTEATRFINRPSTNQYFRRD